MNQLIVRIMNHKKNRFKSNLKTLKNENNSDSKSDAKNNSNSNSNFNFKKLKSDKEKEKTYMSFNFSKICSYCHKKNHKKLHCRMKNWKTQSDEWKKFNKQEICYHKKAHEIKNKVKNKMKKNDEKIIYFNNLNKDLNVKTLNILCLISNVWTVDSDWYINNKFSFHSIYNCNAFMIFLQLFEFEILKNVKSNFIIYMKIKTIKLQIDDQMFTIQNVCYNDDLAYNLIFYRLLKWQSFKIENVEKNELNIFKITDSQE